MKASRKAEAMHAAYEKPLELAKARADAMLAAILANGEAEGFQGMLLIARYEEAAEAQQILAGRNAALNRLARLQ